MLSSLIFTSSLSTNLFWKNSLTWFFTNTGSLHHSFWILYPLIIFCIDLHLVVIWKNLVFISPTPNQHDLDVCFCIASDLEFTISKSANNCFLFNLLRLSSPPSSSLLCHRHKTPHHYCLQPSEPGLYYCLPTNHSICYYLIRLFLFLFTAPTNPLMLKHTIFIYHHFLSLHLSFISFSYLSFPIPPIYLRRFLHHQNMWTLFVYLHSTFLKLLRVRFLAKTTYYN